MNYCLFFSVIVQYYKSRSFTKCFLGNAEFTPHAVESVDLKTYIATKATIN